MPSLASERAVLNFFHQINIFIYLYLIYSKLYNLFKLKVTIFWSVKNSSVDLHHLIAIKQYDIYI